MIHFAWLFVAFWAGLGLMGALKDGGDDCGGCRLRMERALRKARNDGYLAGLAAERGCPTHAAKAAEYADAT